MRLRARWRAVIAGRQLSHSCMSVMSDTTGIAATQRRRHIVVIGEAFMLIPERPPSSPARPAASGSASRAALAASGANVMLNGFGDADEIEALRAEIANGAQRQGRSTAAPTCRTANEIAGMIARRRDASSAGSTSSSTMPASSTSRRSRISRREVGRDPRHQPHQRVPHHAAGAARHEEERLGPHRQRRLGARAGRLALQVGLCRRQARHRRPDQDGRRSKPPSTASPSTRSAPAMC